MSEAPSEKESADRPDSDTSLRQKVILWTLAALIIMFWDDLLGFLLHALHILLEYLELATEEIIIHLFHVEEHEGQMYTAWLGLTAFVVLSAWTYRTVRRKFKARFRSWAYFRSWIKVYSQEHRLSLLLITLFYTAYLVFL